MYGLWQDDAGSMDQSNELSEFSEEDKKGKDDDFTYEVLTPEEVMAKPLQMIEEVNEVLQVHPMLARQVLQYFHWNKVRTIVRVLGRVLTLNARQQENAVQRFFAEQEKIFKEAKLPRPEQMKTLADLPNKVTCTICFDECVKKVCCCSCRCCYSSGRATDSHGRMWTRCLAGTCSASCAGATT